VGGPGALGGGGLYPSLSGGVSPFTYSWSNGNTSSWLPFAGLSSGIYSVSVTDANGCSATAVDTLTVHALPHINITSSANPIEEGDVDTLTASGGIGYAWSDGTTGNRLIVHPLHTTGYSVYGWDSNGCSNTMSTVVIITRDYWLPSPDTTIPHLKSFPPIYFAGNVSVGRDSAASPHQALEVHGNEIIDTNLTVKGNIKSDSLHVRYFVADSIKTGVINLPDSVLRIGDPLYITTPHLCGPTTFQACGGFLFDGLTTIPTTFGIGTKIWGKATLDVEGASGGLPGLLVGSGNVGIGATTPIAQFQINQIGVGWQTGNNSISMGAMGNGDNPYPWSYLGFNAARSGTGIWSTGSDNFNNGGVVIMNTAAGGLNFATIPTTGNTIQNISSDLALTSNNTVMQLTSSGELVIGPPTTIVPSGYLLAVNGHILATDVMVKEYGSWPDYVFKNDYELKTLEELEKYINVNQHLPGLPSSSEIKAKGVISVEEMLSAHTQKLEELTLYIIQLNKKLDALEEENKKLKEAANHK
jgi:hypothetical protein